MPFRMSLKKLIRRDPAASLRERAAELQARIPAPRPTAEPQAEAPPSHAERVVQAGGTGDVLAVCGIDHRDGTVSYADATGKVSRRPMARWVAFNALQMHSHVQAEIGRRRIIEANPLPAEEYAAWDAKIRRELRSDAIAALMLHPERAFSAEQARRSGADGLVDEDPASDALLLQLGRQFEDARAREVAACEACNAAQEEADQHMPERPAALVFRASDHPLRLGKYLTHPDHLEGVEVTSEDVEWMRRKPYVREVRRPVRPEDNLPSDARTVVEAHPWPEAQERADEIATAWDAWHAEKLRIHGEHVTEALDDAANEAGNVATDLALRIADLPAHTAAGLRVKLRALACYNPSFFYLNPPELPDPDQALAYSLGRDMRAEVPTAVEPAVAPQQATRILGGMLDLPSATLDELRTIREVADHVGSIAYAQAWRPCCRRRTQQYGAPDYNDAGKLMLWLGDALTDVESAVDREARQRVPSNRDERETRLSMRAVQIIDNGDPDEIAAFAGELLAHATAELASR